MERLPPLPSPTRLAAPLLAFALLTTGLPSAVWSQASETSPRSDSAGTAEQDAAAVSRLRSERVLADYFARATEQLAAAPASSTVESATVVPDSLEDWLEQREVLRAQLLEMLGLDPLPEKTPLEPVITGRVERDDFVVENLHFQSRPGLYVTGNLYLPREVTAPLPTILYVCGHGNVKRDGISYGSKAHYQHHGAWFARNGFACLVIDTLQLGEIEGIHHGTYRYDRWWWLNRGYTPAGVEAWNCVRALDYLETRPEVDATRFGVTGRSGGGAYSWWIAAIDERIAAAVPVAGTTDLENHVVDGVVEGHCDCMYMVNTYGWDYPQVAALVAPRPLLLSNTDRDRIFPLEGVVRTHRHVREIYRLYGANEQFALQITAGPHADTQELHIHAFRWFNEHLRDDRSPIDKVATRFFQPEELKVFEELPPDELNTTIDQHFVPKAADLTAPMDSQQWENWREEWMSQLQSKTFRAWPAEAIDPSLRLVAHTDAPPLRIRAYEFASQEGVVLPLLVVHPSDLENPESVTLEVANGDQWNGLLSVLSSHSGEIKETLAAWRPEPDPSSPPDESQSPASSEAPSKVDASTVDAWIGQLANSPAVLAFTAPRGVGPTEFPGDARKQIQLQRRFYLLGQTLEGMQTWDVRQAIRALRSINDLADTPIRLAGMGRLAGVALYASLFEEGIEQLELHELPVSHDAGPYLLNVQRFLDLPHALAMAVERTRVVLYGEAEPWRAVEATRQALGIPAERLEIRSADTN
jgi:dienelactone hydrolase